MVSNKIIRLAIISFVLMFLDMLLIRLVGTEIRVFAYISNLILLTVFLGSGMGMFMKRPVSLTVSIGGMALLTGLLATNILSPITDSIGPISDSYIWTFGVPAETWISVVLGILEMFFLLVLITAIFIPIGQYVSKFFTGGPYSISFYSINILFSIVGMWIFYGLSGMAMSPYIGIFLGQSLLLLLIPRKNWLLPAFLSAITLCVIVFAVPKNTLWSPYQKLSITPLSGPRSYHEFLVTVNNVGFMVLDDLSKQAQEKSIEHAVAEHRTDRTDMSFLNSYALPYLIKPSPKDVLIIGAGGGNDASAAIRANAQHIDAVEIDPTVISLGTRYHPEHPYANARIQVINDDGRSFIKKVTKKYDIVVLGFADSHTTNSSVTNIQLDNYLYTLESYQEIKNILKPDGIFILSFSVPKPWVGSHIQQTLTRAFHQKPVMFTFEHDDVCLAGCDGTFFVTALDMDRLYQDIARVPDFWRFINQRRTEYPIRTNIIQDDWPYLYLLDRRIPNLHVIASVFLFALLVLLGRKVSLVSRLHGTAFLLGMAFLLYEFQNITRTSLLFGNTWTVNVYTITAILFMGVLANIVYYKFPLQIRFSYIGLFLSLLLEILIPLSLFNRMGFIGRLTISSVVLYLPVFFSGIIFIDLFSHAKDKQSFLGSNFVGSFFGGLLSLLSYVFGLHAMLYLGTGIYALSALLEFRHEK